jgi:tetratricopeptide (TPR) repeat protein
MLQKDNQGLTLSGCNAHITNEINSFIDNMVGNGIDANHILETSQENPDNALCHIYAATLYLYGQTQTDIKKSLKCLEEARIVIKHANQRETLLFSAVSAWANTDFFLAIKLFTHILAIYPTDLLSLKYLEWLFYLTGQQYQAAPFLAACEKIKIHHHNSPHFYSTYSFSLELNGLRFEAIKKATRAIELEPITPWAHHTLAHAYFFSGEFKQAISTLETVKPTWRNIVPTLKCHNNWHLGLFYIAQGETEKANKLFHQSIWSKTPALVLEQLDAISYLWRMEMASLTPSQSWEAILSYIRPHALDAYTPFNALFYIYASTRANDDVFSKAILENAKKFSQNLSGVKAYAWQYIGLPAITATYAFAKEDHKLALTYLNPIMENISACGGSDAQIEIMNEMYCVALLKTNQKDKATRVFKQSLSFYKNTTLEKSWF